MQLLLEKGRATVCRVVLTLWQRCRVGGQCPGRSRLPFPALFPLRGRKPRSEQQELGKVGPVALESCNAIYLFNSNMARVLDSFQCSLSGDSFQYGNQCCSCLTTLPLSYAPNCALLPGAWEEPRVPGVLQQTHAGEVSPGTLGVVTWSYRGFASARRTPVNEHAALP